MSLLDKIKTQIQNLINTANEKTGNTDATLTAAVGSLVSGYGGGSDVNEIELILLNQLEEFLTEKEFTYKNNFFMQISSIKKISVPNAIGGSSYNFYGCAQLEYVDMGRITSITQPFIGSHKLKTIIIRKNDSIAELKSPVTDNSNNLLNGVTLIYVPRALVEDYKVATNWAPFANQFRALEDYTVDGTVTGAFDESKI